MIANIITLARILLVFVVVFLFQINNVFTRLFASLLVVVVISLDSLDGYVARKMNVASDFGALFDITGDRIIENVFWIYYAVIGFISYWVPLIIISRSFIVDAVRAVAFRKGKTAFGKNTMMKSALTRFMVASPFSRSLYSGQKIAIFTLVGLLFTLKTGVVHLGWAVSIPALDGFKTIIDVLVYTTVATCIIRGLPVLWDGKEILFEKEYPKKINIG
jgi:CDP-diacylglycerol--glycerol-3-phosphate 3-phosphatidyltransferase